MYAAYAVIPVIMIVAVANASLYVMIHAWGGSRVDRPTLPPQNTHLEMGSTLLKEEDPPNMSPHVIDKLPLLTLFRISMQFPHGWHPKNRLGSSPYASVFRIGLAS